MHSASSPTAGRSFANRAAYAGAATLAICALTALLAQLLAPRSGASVGQAPGLNDAGPIRQQLQPEWLELTEARRLPTAADASGVAQGLAAGGATPSLLVFVHDKDGQPVTNAHVRGLIAGHSRADGLSDANGICGLSLPETEQVQILASAKQGFGQLVLAPSIRPLIAEVLLSDAGTLNGSVVDQSGNPIQPGVQVLAVRARLVEAYLREAAQPAAEPGRAAHGLTDEHGAFHLEGLEPGAEYLLWACAPGWGTPNPLSAKAGAEDLVLRAQPVYGLALNFVDPSGKAAQLSPYLQDLRHTRIEWPGPGIEPLLLDGPVARVQGLPGDLDQGGSNRLFLVTAPKVHSDGLPIRYACRFPGYEPIELELFMQPLSRNQLARVEVPLRPRGNGLGRLTVQAFDHHGMPRSVPAGRVVLRRPGMPVSESLEFTHGTESSGLLDLGPVPLGAFEFNWFSSISTLSWPEAPLSPVLVEVQPEGSEVEMHFQPTYSIELVPVLADGRSWRGSLSLRFGPSDQVQPDGKGGTLERDVVFRTLDGPPYKLEDLTESKYHLVFAPQPGGDEVEAWVELKPDVPAKLEINGLVW